jgi:hypothetical protein
MSFQDLVYRGIIYEGRVTGRHLFLRAGGKIEKWKLIDPMEKDHWDVIAAEQNELSHIARQRDLLDEEIKNQKIFLKRTNAKGVYKGNTPWKELTKEEKSKWAVEAKIENQCRGFYYAPKKTVKPKPKNKTPKTVKPKKQVKEPRRVTGYGNFIKTLYPYIKAKHPEMPHQERMYHLIEQWYNLEEYECEMWKEMSQ